MRKLLRSFIIEGLLMIALGIVMLIWPEQSHRVIITVIGAAFALMGLVRLITFFAYKEYRSGFDIIFGLLLIAAGVFLILKPDVAAKMYSTVIGVLLAYGAFVLFVFSIRWRRGFMCLLGVLFALLLAACAAIIILEPAAFADYMTMVRGAALIMEGIFLLIVTSRISR